MLLVASVVAVALPSYPTTRPSAKSNTILLNQSYANTLSRRQDDVYLQGFPYYFGPVTIGNGNILQLVFDTGSTPLVVSQDALPSDSTIQNTGTPCEQGYGSGGGVTCKGNWYTAPYSFSEFSANAQLCVCTFSGGNGNGAAFGSGILGMGFAKSTGEGSPLYQFEGGAGLVAFGIYLSADRNGGGAFTPNDYDPAFVQEGAPFAIESVDSSYSEWSFGVDHFEYEGVSYKLGLSDGFVDTGNPTINVSPDAAQNLWSLTGADPSTGFYGGNCNPGGDPVTIVSSSGNRYDIAAVHYVLGPDRNGNCQSAFKAATGDHMVIGTPFIKQYYTYFDVANSQISFALSSG